MNNKEIHIWHFPPSKTFIKLQDKFRKNLFNNLMNKVNFHKAAEIINSKANKYGLKRNYHASNISTWKSGSKKEKDRITKINIPLWVLIEISKILSKSKRGDNEVMKGIEKNIKYITSSGKGVSVYTEFPILLTPELVSIIFHFCGDGHIGKTGDTSHYRQMNLYGLTNFLNKLKNIFGDFEINKNDFKKERLLIPKIISEFYVHYFGLNNCMWNTARIPENIKNLPREFLIAGLTAFIVDEGCIGHAIEIYSSNKKLLEDIREVSVKLGYECSDEKKKSSRPHESNQYRFCISLQSAVKFYEDIKKIKNNFPTCDLAHKLFRLERIIRRKRRNWFYRKNGVTKKQILSSLRNERTSSELANELNIDYCSVNEHLRKLEKSGKVKRIGRKGKYGFLWKKVD